MDALSNLMIRKNFKKKFVSMNIYIQTLNYGHIG